MKLRFLVVFSFLAVFGTTNQSCEKEKGSNTTNISSHGASESHNMGKNCMTCHVSGGEGQGWFQVAGTCYNSALTNTYANVTVKLYTGPDGTGTLRATIDGDANGNFFTTASVDFTGGLYPAVTGSGATKYMPMAISNGQCNSCHGVSSDKIWTN
ncbi:MAG: hypothetical protein AUJ98_10580 [Bacteroidetes bacterium CG2_30_33_31]|nr:MAG: hypothetical protein AUJ98_10580 [Bacteroidetes bacterium CG2_30_33_31]